MDDFRTKLTPTECKEVHRGIGRNNREYVIYAVKAVKEDGSPIDLKLNTFSELPIGQLIEVDVTERVDEKYGPSYTLKPVGGQAGGRLGPKVDAVTERLDALEERVKRLEGGRSSGVDSADSPAPPPTQEAPAPTQQPQQTVAAPAESRFGDNPPF